MVLTMNFRCYTYYYRRKMLVHYILITRTESRILYQIPYMDGKGKGFHRPNKIWIDLKKKSYLHSMLVGSSIRIKWSIHVFVIPSSYESVLLRFINGNYLCDSFIYYFGSDMPLLCLTRYIIACFYLSGLMDLRSVLTMLLDIIIKPSSTNNMMAIMLPIWIH